MLSKGLIIITITVIKVISSQRFCSCEKSTTERIVQPFTGNPESLCKDLSAAIQNVIISTMKTNAAKRPLFGQISQPLIDEIAKSLPCRCPVCTRVSISSNGGSAPIVSSNTPVNVLNTVQGNTVSSCGYPKPLVASNLYSGFLNAANNLISTANSVTNTLPNSLCVGNPACGCKNAVPILNTAGKLVCSSCGFPNGVSNSDNSPCMCKNPIPLLNAAGNVVCSSCGYKNTSPNVVLSSSNSPCTCKNIATCGCSSALNTPVLNTATNLVNCPCGCSNELNIFSNYPISGCSKIIVPLSNTANHFVAPCSCSALNGPANLASSPCCCNNAKNLANSISNSVISRSAATMPENVVSFNDKYLELLNLVESLSTCSSKISV